MNTPESKEQRFLDALVAVSAPGDASLAERTEKLRHELLWFGSSTPDNRAAAERIAVNEIRGQFGGRHLGISLAGSGSLVSDVLNAAEGGPVPEKVLEYYPDLQEEDWHAVLRIAVLALLAFEGPQLADEDEDDGEDEDEDDEEG